jgi:hypothetical protein
MDFRPALDLYFEGPNGSQQASERTAPKRTEHGDDE